jgi:hypothetical protein
MLTPSRYFVLIALSIATTACTPGPSTPSATSRYEGQWSGTTSQGAAITFTVSTDRTVRTIAVGYSFNGCSGVRRFDDLDVEIGNARSPGISPPFFFYRSGSLGEPQFTSVDGRFDSDSFVVGHATFDNWPGCGEDAVIANWTATKH